MGSSGSKDLNTDITDVKRTINSNIRELDRQILAAERGLNELVRRMKYKHTNGNIEEAKYLAQEIQNKKKIIANYKSTKSQFALLLSKIITANAMNKLTTSIKKSCILLKNDNMDLNEFQKILHTLDVQEAQDSVKQELIQETFMETSDNIEDIFKEYNLTSDKKQISEMEDFEQRIINLSK